jgi:hypothetical protein
MKDDPIVEEVRKNRQARAARFNYDVDAIAADARKRERAGKRRVAQSPRKKPQGTSTKASLGK